MNDFKSIFYMTLSDLDNFNSFKIRVEPWVKLLAHEDNSLKGYFESRERYMEIQYKEILFNKIGEIRASIIHNGMAIGLWNYDKIAKCINWQSFSKTTAACRKLIENEVNVLEAILFT